MSEGRARLAIAALTLFFALAGLVGVDYGDKHWDEPTNVKQLAWALEHRVPFPRWYHYGTTTTWVLAVAAVPELLENDLDHVGAALVAPPYRLRARALLILLTSLVVPLTYALARSLGRSVVEGVGAAALVAVSFQLGTHARFIAPDGILTALMTAAMVLLARGRLVGAAFVVGLAAGAKYSAGVLLVPVVVAALRTEPAARTSATVRVVLASALAFIASTPGALFEPALVVVALRFQSIVYATGWIGYSVGGPLGVARTFVEWLAFSALSPFFVLGPPLLALAVVGLVDVVRRHRSVVWLGPTLTVALFLLQSVFFVRNFLPLLPFLAILVVQGLAVLVRDRAVVVHRLAVAAMAVVVAVNGAFLAFAAETVAHRSGERVAADVERYVRAHPGETFLASPKVRAVSPDEPNLVAAPTPATKRLLALPSELFAEWEWPSNDPFVVERVFGPREIDWPWYTTWRGDARVLLMDIDEARAKGAALDFAPRPTTPPPHFPMEMLGR